MWNMAKRKSVDKKTGSNSSATERVMALATTNPSGPQQARTLVEAPRVLSLANRRLYRQTRVYRCKISIQSQAEEFAAMPVYALANNWYVRKSIALARDMFNLAVKEERAVVGSARWNDFRIKSELPTANELYPQMLEMDGLTYQTLGYGSNGEYNYSEVEVAGNSKNFTIATQTNAADRYNIFEEYEKMGPNAPESPMGTSVGGYDLIDASFEIEEVQELLDKGNLPPYDAETAGTPPVWVQVGELQLNAVTGVKTLSTGFFDAPLGLIWMPTLGNPALALSKSNLFLEVAAGDYKGVHSVNI